jgi:adenylate cyclase
MVSDAPRVQRRLAAIFAADIAGYSRLVEADESSTLAVLTTHREIMDGLIASHGGRIANTAGDSVLAEFPSVVDAVQCAATVQEKLAHFNTGGEPDRALSFRIGIHVGDVVVKGGDLLGDGVNIAARVQALAEPGGVWISAKAHDELEGKHAYQFEDMGEQQVKNIARPIRVYALVGALFPGRRPVTATAQRPAVAVLPFANLSGEKDDYFSDGITEDIITALTRVRSFHVIARNSVFGYRREAQDIRQVARDLGASYVLEGSVRKEGSRLRMTAQLVDGATGNHVWAKRYDREVHDVFAVQDDLTESIVGSVEPELRKAERERARVKRTDNMTAWDYGQRGLWHLYRRTRPDFVEAQVLLQRALDIDGNHVPALCALSETHVFQVLFGFSENPDEDRQQAMRLARRAVEVDDQDPLALCALGRAYLANRKHRAAIPYIEEALALNPTLAWAHYLLGVCRAYSGRAKEALPYLETAIRLSPHDPYASRFFACGAEALFFLGEYEEAVTWGQKAIRQANTAHWSGHTALAATLAKLGRAEEAAEVIQELLQHRPDFSLSLMCKAISLTDTDCLAAYSNALREAGAPE